MRIRAPLTLEQVNAASAPQFVTLLTGIYEHSPWVAERAAAQRPFASLAALKLALVQAVRQADPALQLGLIRAHPELAGKAMISRTLTAESTQEQAKAGLSDCTSEEFERLQQLNAAYNDRFGFPFILAVRGSRGQGLSKAEIMATFERRVQNAPDFERAECLRNIHRIAEIRLNDAFGLEPSLGNQVWDWCEQLAHHSEQSDALTVTYLSEAHRACASQLADWMRHDCGFDHVQIDAVGNVVGIYHAARPTARRLLCGSHYDTVRHAGKYDGRLGIAVVMAAVSALHGRGQRLPFGIELVAFSEEEGQRYPATFLGSSALTGSFDPNWLDQRDAQGISMREAMQAAGLNPADIAGLRRDPADYLGFIEVHIEQGPVLNAMDVPLGVVRSINGSVRYQGEILGQASHAGTTPMSMRHDAAAAAAELTLYLERRASQVDDLVGTVGRFEVPHGSVNVVPGRCCFSLDIRATTNAVRDACAADTLAELQAICRRRDLQYRIEQTLCADAAPSAPDWQQRWEQAVAALGLPVHGMPSGAGHDAMKLHAIMPQAMLFVRGLNAGISHNPLESVSNDDADLAVRALLHLLQQLATELT